MSTFRQKLAASKISENIRNGAHVPLGVILRSVGYSKSTSLNPDQVTESRGFQELVDKYIPQEDLARAHRRLLDAQELSDHIFPVQEDDKVIKDIIESGGCELITIIQDKQCKRAYYRTLDTRAVVRGLDMAYKVRGLYAKTRRDWTTTEENTLTDEEIDQRRVEIARRRKELLESRNQNNQIKPGMMG